MIQPQYRFYLLKDAATYYVAAGGAVSTTTNPTPLKSAPKNWEQTKLSWIRNAKYHGIFRSQTTPYQWVRDGAAIMRHVYYTQGIEGRCLLRIDMRNPDGSYSTLFSGDIDFSRTKDSEYFFGANVLEAGLASVLKANESTDYEIPIDASDCVNVNLDGISLLTSYNWVVPEQGIPPGQEQVLSNSFTIVYVNSEGISSGVGSNASYRVPPPFPVDLTLASNSFYTANSAQDVTLRFKGTVFAFWPSSASGNRLFTLALKFGNPGAVTSHIFYQGSALAPGQSATYSIDVTHTFSLAAGDTIAILALMLDGAGSIFHSLDSRMRWLGDQGAVTLSTVHRLPPTQTRAYYESQVWSKLVDKVSAGAYSGESGFLSDPTPQWDNVPAATVVASGDALRRIHIDITGAQKAPVIRTTLAEFVHQAQAIWGLGLGAHGESVGLEPIGSFYRGGTLIAALGAVKSFSAEPATEWYWNVVKAGYPNVETDENNGRNEYNTTSVWKVPITRITGQELDLVSQYNPAVYAIEYQRANLIGKNTTDGKQDNDTFLLSINSNPESNGSYNLRRVGAGGSTSGVLSPADAFNVDLTPARNLRRNLSRIRVATHLLSGQELTFQTSDKNQELVSTFPSSVEVVEKGSIALSPTDDRFVLPLLFKFETPAPVNLKALLDSNPYGYFSFTWLGHLLKGFLIECSILPTTKAVQEWTLLAHPDCDLSLLHG